MFRPYEFWRHKNTLDTDIQIVNISYIGQEYIKLKVHFVDRKHTGHFQMNYKAKIYRKDFKNWSLIK